MRQAARMHQRSALEPSSRTTTSPFPRSGLPSARLVLTMTIQSTAGKFATENSLRQASSSSASRTRMLVIASAASFFTDPYGARTASSPVATRSSAGIASTPPSCPSA